MHTPSRQRGFDLLAFKSAIQPRAWGHHKEIWGVEATLAYSGHRGFAGAADLIGVYEGRETILDFKQSNKPRKDEWNEDSYYLQLAGYSLCHNKTYGTNIDQGVILLCTKDLMFQRFVVDSELLKKFQQIFFDKVNQYYELLLNI